MKKILSLVLALAMMATMLVVPTMAAEVPTATVNATLAGDTVPAAGEKFIVNISIDNISSGYFISGEAYYSWPTEVASLVRYTGTNLNPITNAATIGGIYDKFDADEFTGKYSAVNSIDAAAGTGQTSIYINLDAEDQEATVATNVTMFGIAFVLNEGYTYDDFYLTLTNAKACLTSDVETAALNASTVDNGALSLGGIKPAAPDVEYTDANGITYKAVSDNLVTGWDQFTMANNGGALTWPIVAANTVNPDAAEGVEYIHFTGAATGGSDVNTMRTFFPIEGGKLYYVTNTIYNNTGVATKNQDTAGMSSIIATSNPVFGTFAGLTVYSDIEYGGVTSWHNGNSDVTLAGSATNRNDITSEVGYNKIEYLLTTPAEATNIMISYGAWGNSELYYGDFAIYEMEIASTLADMVINYTDADGNVVMTETKTGSVGNTVAVEAGEITVEGVKYMVEAAEGTYVAGGSTLVVNVKKVETVTVNFMYEGEVAKTVTVEGVNGAEVPYAAVQIVKNGALVGAAAGTVVVDAANLTAEVELVAVENAVVASKTESYNVTAGAVYPYPNNADRNQALVGTDAMFSASWTDVRYGEMVFDLVVEEGKKIETATLTLTPGDVMSGYENTFEIYAADPATYGTANDLAALTVVGSGAFVGNDVPADVTLDLSAVDASNGIMLLYKVVGERGGLVGVYGASFEQAPYMVYTLGDADEPEVPSDVTTDEPEVPSDVTTDEPEVPSDEPEVPSDEPEVPSDEPEVPSDEPEVPSDEPEVPSDEPEVPSDEPEVPSDEPEVPSDEPEVPSDEPEVPSDEPEVPSDEPEVPSDEPEVPSDEPEVPSDEPEVPSDEPEVPSDEPSEEPGDEEELPYEAVDVVVTPSALGVTISGKFVLADEEYEATETVVVVISYLKDGKAYSVQAVEVQVINGEVEIPSSQVTLTEGELSVAGISLLTGVDALTAITTGNLGTPVGVWK